MTQYVARFIQEGPIMMQHAEDDWVTSLFRLLMLALVIAGVIWVAKILVHRDNTSDAASATPLDIAKERYAKGDISKDQLDEIRKELNK